MGFEGAVLILSTDYQQMQPLLASAPWLAVIPYFPNPQAALDACAQAGLVCDTLRPARCGGRDTAGHRAAQLTGPPAQPAW